MKQEDFDKMALAFCADLGGRLGIEDTDPRLDDVFDAIIDVLERNWPVEYRSHN